MRETNLLTSSQYSTTIFVQGGYSRPQALLFSMGTGILNWVFALPAFFTIDTFGRRFLLLVTFPFLAITLLWTGMSFFLGETDADGNCIGNCTPRTAMITTGMYLYEVFYSPGMGPVPFSYSAEVFPIQVSLPAASPPLSLTNAHSGTRRRYGFRHRSTLDVQLHPLVQLAAARCRLPASRRFRLVRRLVRDPLGPGLALLP